MKVQIRKEDNIDVVESIKNIILNRYPILENRMDALELPRVLEINMKFYKDDHDQEGVHIMFLDGTNNFKCSIPERIMMNQLITTEMLCNLIQFIVADHDWVDFLEVPYNNAGWQKIKLSFLVNQREDNMRGMGCWDIQLVLDFSKHSDKKELTVQYLDAIVHRFYKQLKDTPYIRRQYHDYCLKEKTKILNSFSDSELHDFMNLLSTEEVCQILSSLEDQRFIELYQNFMEQKSDCKDNNRQLVKK